MPTNAVVMENGMELENGDHDDPDAHANNVNKHGEELFEYYVRIEGEAVAQGATLLSGRGGGGRELDLALLYQ